MANKTNKSKDPAAQSLAYKRWRGVSAEERSRLMRRASKIAAAKLSPKRRHEIASNAARSRWSQLTPEERSAEMRRRAVVRKQKRIDGAAGAPDRNAATKKTSNRTAQISADAREWARRL